MITEQTFLTLREIKEVSPFSNHRLKEMGFQETICLETAREKIILCSKRSNSSSWELGTDTIVPIFRDLIEEHDSLNGVQLTAKIKQKMSSLIQEYLQSSLNELIEKINEFKKRTVKEFPQISDEIIEQHQPKISLLKIDAGEASLPKIEAIFKAFDRILDSQAEWKLVLSYISETFLSEEFSQFASKYGSEKGKANIQQLVSLKIGQVLHYKLKSKPDTKEFVQRLLRNSQFNSDEILEPLIDFVG